MSHWLQRLLSPKSIAIVGASSKKGSLAYLTCKQLTSSGYSGILYFINPKYDEMFNQRCYCDLTELPQVPDLVVFVISGLPLEASFDQAIALQVGGMLMYASNQLDDKQAVSLPERLKQKARAANIPVMGGNSMGYYNYDDNVFVSFDTPPQNRPAGGISLIAHSGSVMTYLANNDARFCFNYVIASGQETHANVADYMDYLLDQSSTRVIALFLETVRHVPSFIKALSKARQHDIPIVITKIGRTEKSAKLAVSHSGAIAGDHDAFIALCHRYGVILTNDIDEMITTALLLANCNRVTSDGVASILDSGGMRELMIDLADDYGLRFAAISKETKARIADNLEYGLAADNPLDAMGALGNNVEHTYYQCAKALIDDPDSGLLTYEFEFRDGFSHYPQMFNVIDRLVEESDKPVLVINSFTFSNLNQTAVSMSHAGIVMINGLDLALRSIRNFCRYCLQQTPEPSSVDCKFDQPLVDEWVSVLTESESLDEFTSLGLMNAFNLPVISHAMIDSVEELLEYANHYSYPLVLKTVEPGIAHKSEHQGVKLNLNNQSELLDAYQALCESLGDKAMIMPMAKGGVEIGLGMKNDPQFGPLIIVSAGGILIELIKDRVISLAPVSPQQASESLDQLKINALLSGVRGQPAADKEALINLIVEFSKFVVNFSEHIAEIDLNPVIVHQQGCTIVDALVVPRADKGYISA